MKGTQTAVGQRYGKLLIIELGERQGRNTYHDRVLCECGTIKTVRRADLKSGSTKSCGCWRRERCTSLGAATRTHGWSRHPLYHRWLTMIARCHNPKSTAWCYYGARGIKVCDRWRESLDAFSEDVGARPAGTELDRIDPDGDYEPGNVRWASRRLQKLNRTARYDHYTPRPITWKGKTYAISELAAIAGISYSAMYGRLMSGMDPQAAISTPLRGSIP